MSQDTPSGSKQDMKHGSIVSRPQTSCNMPASSPDRGGRQDTDRGPGWNCGIGRGVGQGRGGRHGEYACQGWGRSQSHGQGQGYGPDQIWAADQIQGVGQIQGGHREQNRVQMGQPSAQPQNPYQGANQTPIPWRGPTVIHRHRMALRQPATHVSQTAMGNKEGVRKGVEGTSGVERKGRERGRLRVGGRYGCGRGTVPSKSVTEISPTTALFPNSVEEFMTNRIPDEDEFYGGCSKSVREEISGEGCVSFRKNARNEADSQSCQMDKSCDDQSIVYLDTSERVFLNLTSDSCISDKQEQDEEEKSEEMFISEGILPESIGLPFVRKPTHCVGSRNPSIFGALKGARGGFRGKGVAHIFEPGGDAARLRSDDVMIEVSDGSDARSLASKCSRSQIAGSEVDASLGYAGLYRKTRAIQSKGRGESRNRRQCAGGLLANNSTLGFGRGRCYLGAREDVDMLQRIQTVLVDSQDALGGGRARQSTTTAQSETLVEEWENLTNESQQLQDNDQIGCESDRMKSSDEKREWKEISNDTVVVEGDSAISNSRPVFEVDQNLVVEYLVNHHNGSCTLFDVRNNSGMFPCILQAEQVLRSLGCCDFIRVLIDPSDLNNSVVKVYMEKLRLCVENCSETNNCQRIHLCREFLMDCCFSSRNCSVSHDLDSEHNRKIMVDCGIERFSADQKLSLIRCSNLLVCREYNGLKGCPVPSSCFKIHVCNSYIMRNCSLAANTCPNSHILFNERNLKILRLFEVDQLKVEFLLRIIVGFHIGPVQMELEFREYFQSLGGRTKPAKDSSSYSGRGQVSARGVNEQKVMGAGNSRDHCGKNYNSEKPSRTYNSARKSVLQKSSGIVKERCVPAASSECKETRRGVLSLGEQQKNRCESFEEHTCCQMEICTKRHRSETAYLWRVQVRNEWMDLENNELIEEEFSNPEAEKFWGSTWDTTVCIDFSSLKSDVGLIQRLSTPSYVVCRDKVDATRWLWYWLDATGKWVLYGQNNQPPYQDVLEAKFLNDSRHVCCFETNGYKYELDFAKMEQRNLQTNFCRPIRRRPLFRNGEALEMPNIEYHYEEWKLPLDWVPMDTESKHGMELVPLRPDDAAYEIVRDGFFSTLRSTHFEINRIYRLQNLKLWHSFQMKTMIMENETGSEVEEVLAYHGTPEEETVRWICSLGFDQRMHGKHGSKYGAGAYFATTAKFSHCYTQPSENGLRYMFCARVLVGRTVKGKHEYKRPPPIDPTKPTEGLFDTCVDNTSDPSIYVVFDNSQSYPEYLIEYRDTAAAQYAYVDRWQPTYAYSPYLASASYPAHSPVVSSSGRAWPSSYQIYRPSSSSVLPPSLNCPPNATSSGSHTLSSARPIIRDMSATTSALQADVSASATASVPTHHAAASVAPDEVDLLVCSSDDSLSYAPSSDDKSYSCHIM